MAHRRMFSPDIVASDAFLEMPTSSRELYFQLGMYADDDGFVNPKKIMRMIGASDDDLKVLLLKRFLISFESGVIVIKHWLIHNLIRADLYKETLYKNEKKLLGLNENGAYTELREGVSEIKTVESPEWLKRRRNEQRTANVPQTALRLGKDRLGKDRESTPSQDNKDFFERGETFTKLSSAFSKNQNVEFISKEIDKFILYWTEPNKSGTKVRWEQQSTFDVKRRLFTWLTRAKEYSSKLQGKKRNVIL